MKIRTVFLSLAASCAMLVSAELPAPSAITEVLPRPSVKRQKAVFEAGTAPLDKNGDSFSFQSVYALTSYAKYFPGAIAKLVLANGGEKQDANDAEDLCRILVEVINPSVLKSIGSSSAELESDIYRSQNYFYTGKMGMASYSIFALTGKKNHKLNWSELPADTRLAFETDFYPGILYKRTVAALGKSKNPDLQQIPAMLEEFKKQGLDLETTLNGVTKISLLVVGSDLQSLGVSFSITDESGKIAEELQKRFPAMQGSNLAAIPSPVPMFVPVIRYGEKEVTFASSKELLTRKVPAKTGDINQIRKFAGFLPAEGTGYLYVNIDQNSIDNVKLMLQATEKKDFAKLLAPFAFVSISSVTSEGYLSTTVSDFSSHTASMKITAIATLNHLVSAFVSSRQAARQAAVRVRFEAVGSAMLAYAEAHKGALPKTLKELAGTMEDGCPVCVDEKNPPIYLGAGMNLSNLKNAGTMPVILEAPPVGKIGACVLFADGHAECVQLDNYKEPAQLIGELNKIYEYTPEQLDALLKAASAK